MSSELPQDLSEIPQIPGTVYDIEGSIIVKRENPFTPSQIYKSYGELYELRVQCLQGGRIVVFIETPTNPDNINDRGSTQYIWTNQPLSEGDLSSLGFPNSKLIDNNNES